MQSPSVEDLDAADSLGAHADSLGARDGFIQPGTPASGGAINGRGSSRLLCSALLGCDAEDSLGATLSNVSATPASSGAVCGAGSSGCPCEDLLSLKDVLLSLGAHDAPRLESKALASGGAMSSRYAALLGRNGADWQGGHAKVLFNAEAS